MHEELRGRKQIAHALGVSTRTVSRMLQRGILPAMKLNGATSPVRIERRAIDHIRKGK